jgi:hypothetical protein
MAPHVLDVVAVLPEALHRNALALSDQLADRMLANGCRSHFRLGESMGSDPGEPCAPHVSIFMLAVEAREIDDIFRTTREVAAALPAITAIGERYAHNPVGAPELYFRKTTEWIELQRSVIAAVEPLRRGRLRDTDPAGDRIRDLLDDRRLDPVRRDQLIRFGYDEVTERWDPPGGGPDDRFTPHVTLAWPVEPSFRVELADLPPAHEFSGTLTSLAVYGMDRHGTCTTPYGTAPLAGAAANTFSRMGTVAAQGT